MKRRLLVPGLGLPVLVGGSWILVVLLTDRAPVTEAPVEAAAQPPALPGSAPAATPASTRAPPWAAAVSRSPPAAQAWTPQVREPSAAGRADRTTRKAVRKALLAAPVEDELARCIDRDREVWFGGGLDSAEPIPRAKPAILMLDLETVGSQVKIADARVKSWGGTSRAAVACAREALIGTVVAASGSTPPRPMQMTFLLSPRSRALEVAR